MTVDAVFSPGRSASDAVYVMRWSSWQQTSTYTMCVKYIYHICDQSTISNCCSKYTLICAYSLLSEICYIHLQPKQGPVICLILWLHSLRSHRAPVDSGMKIANYHEKCLQFVKPQTNIDYRYILFWLADSVKGWRRQLVMITWENLLQDLVPFSDLSIDHLLHDVAVIVFSQSSEAH